MIMSLVDESEAVLDEDGPLEVAEEEVAAAQVLANADQGAPPVAAEELPAVEVPETAEAIVATALQRASGVTAESDLSLSFIIQEASEALGSCGRTSQRQL